MMAFLSDALLNKAKTLMKKKTDDYMKSTN
jgi:hypothetical protein